MVPCALGDTVDPVTAAGTVRRYPISGPMGGFPQIRDDCGQLCTLSTGSANDPASTDAPPPDSVA